MSTAVTTTGGAQSALTIWTDEERRIVKDVICPGLTDSEMLMFASVCRATGLNPIMNQIHAIRRNSRQKIDGRWQDSWRLTIQTSIHGLRLIADRTKCYAPGRKAEFEYDADGNLVSATAFVKKFAGGQWHKVEDTAYWEEYVQLKDEYENERKTGRKVPSALWETKPRMMLSKCAEALALRRAFPAEMAGVYTDDEMPAVEPARIIDRSTGEIIEAESHAATDATLPAANIAPPPKSMPTTREMSGKPEPKPGIGVNRKRLNGELLAAMADTNTAQATVLDTIKDCFGAVRTGDLSDEQVVAVIAWLRDQKALNYDQDGRARLVDIAPTTEPIDIESLPFDREWQDGEATEATEAVATATR